MKLCEKYFILRVFLVSQRVYGCFMINLSSKINSYTQNAGKRQEMKNKIKYFSELTWKVEKESTRKVYRLRHSIEKLEDIFYHKMKLKTFLLS